MEPWNKKVRKNTGTVLIILCIDDSKGSISELHNLSETAPPGQW